MKKETIPTTPKPKLNSIGITTNPAKCGQHNIYK